jgi:hypothetical protein
LLRARIVGISVVVEQVDHRKLAGGNGDAGDVLLAGELVRAIVDRLLLAAQPEGLSHEGARYVEARHRESRFLRLAIGEAGNAHLVGADEQRRRHVEAKCLCGFEIDHQLVLGRLLDRIVGGVPRKILSTYSAARR